MTCGSQENGNHDRDICLFERDVFTIESTDRLETPRGPKGISRRTRPSSTACIYEAHPGRCWRNLAISSLTRSAFEGFSPDSQSRLQALLARLIGPFARTGRDRQLTPDGICHSLIRTGIRDDGLR